MDIFVISIDMGDIFHPPKKYEMPKTSLSCLGLHFRTESTVFFLRQLLVGHLKICFSNGVGRNRISNKTNNKEAFHFLQLILCKRSFTQFLGAKNVSLGRCRSFFQPLPEDLQPTGFVSPEICWGPVFFQRFRFPACWTSNRYSGIGKM